MTVQHSNNRKINELLRTMYLKENANMLVPYACITLQVYHVKSSDDIIIKPLKYHTNYISEHMKHELTNKQFEYLFDLLLISIPTIELLTAFINELEQINEQI